MRRVSTPAPKISNLSLRPNERVFSARLHNTHARTHTHYPPCKLTFVRMETQTPFHPSLFNQMFQLPCQHIFIQALWVLLDIVSSVDFGQ